MESDPQDGVESGACRFLLTLWLTAALSVWGIGTISTTIGHQVHPLDLDEPFLAQFTVAAGYFYADQPAKSLAFEIGCAVTPFIIVLSHAIARSFAPRLKDSLLPIALRGAVGLSGLLFLWCLLPLVYCPHPPLDGMPPRWLLSPWFFVHFLTWTRFLYAGLSCWFVAFLVRRRSSFKHRRLAFLALVFASLWLIPSNFYTPSEVSDDGRFTYHFNVVTHALTQVVNGHHFLIQFPHIYGGYIEFLGPFLTILPRRIDTLLLPFPILHAVAMLGLLLTARLVIRDAPVLFVTGLGLLAFGFMLTSGDHYYAYDPIRTLFPVLGLFAATLFFRRPTRLKYGAVSCVAAVAPIWNLDTGIVLWLSWTATLTAARLGERKPLQALKDLAIQTGVLIAVVLAFLLYLRIVSGLWPDLRMAITFQKLVMGSGYMCVGLLAPDVWAIILTTYAIGLITAFHFYCLRASSWKTHFMLMLSLMGIGLFSYFMGRSTESNLEATSYPFILLAGFLLSETRTLILLNKLPEITWALLFPLGIMIVWWAWVFTLAFPDLLTQSGEVLKTWGDDTGTPFKRNAAFVQKWTVPGEKIFMLSNQSGFYYYLSDTTCPIDIPGPGELLWSKDMNLLATHLGSAQFPKLFVDQNFYTVGTYKSEVYHGIQEVISEHYRPAATSATGQVTLYVPR